MHQSVSLCVCVLGLTCAVQHSGGTARISSFASKTINWIQVMIYELIVVHFIVVYVFCRSISNGIQTIKFIKNSFMCACACVCESVEKWHSPFYNVQCMKHCGAFLVLPFPFCGRNFSQFCTQKLNWATWWGHTHTHSQWEREKRFRKWNGNVHRM